MSRFAARISGKERKANCDHAGDVRYRVAAVLGLCEGIGALGKVERRDEVEPQDGFGKAPSRQAGGPTDPCDIHVAGRRILVHWEPPQDRLDLP